MKTTVDTSKEALMKNRFIIANLLLIALMVSLLMYTLQQTVGVFSINWKGYYLPYFAFVISLIALNSRRKTRDLPFLNKERIVRHISEWVVILLVLKIASYLFNTPSQFLTDIPLWGENFFENFFTIDFIVAIIIALLSWGIAVLLGHPIDQLEEDKALMDQEKLGYTFNDRTTARKQLISTVFLLGGLQLFITAIIRSDIALPGFQVNSSYRLILALILYFLFSFLLLALNQYNLQKARWYLSDVIVSDTVARRWLIFCIILISGVTVIALLLPTRYVIGIFPAIRFLWNILVYIFEWLNALVFLPFLALMGLFRHEAASDNPSEPIAEDPAPVFNQSTTPTLGNDISWWSNVKSLLFWVILIVLIFITLKYYLGQKKGWRDFLGKIQIVSWLKKLWQSVRNALNKISRNGIQVVKNGVGLIREFIANSEKKRGDGIRLFTQLPARLGIIAAYIDLRTWLDTFGFSFSPSTTPNETRNALSIQYPSSIELVDQITDLFIKARYTTHTTTRSHFKQMQIVIDDLKALLQAINSKLTTDDKKIA